MQGFTFSRPSMSLGSNTNMLRSLFLYGIPRIWACRSFRRVKLKESRCVIICTGLLVFCNKFTEHPVSKEAWDDQASSPKWCSPPKTVLTLRPSKSALSVHPVRWWKYDFRMYIPCVSTSIVKEPYLIQPKFLLLGMFFLKLPVPLPFKMHNVHQHQLRGAA